MANITETELQTLWTLVSQNPQEAQQLLASYEQTYAKDENFQHNLGGLLIDLGSALQDAQIVQKGIGAIKCSLDILDEESQALQHYNIGNGYSERYRIEREQEGFEFNPDTLLLQEAKQHYRKALQDRKYLSNDVRVELCVNYGNCLSGLGRTVESLMFYDEALQLDPNHPMALGNLGVELMHYASIASSERIPLLQDALSVLNKALSPECQQELQKQAPTARMQFEQERERIVKYLQGVELPEHNYTPTFANEYHRMYVSFCSEHQLFLNFCRRCQRCVVANKDIVNISLITNSDDTTTFPGLARVVNEIKERYATARLLLFEGYKPAFDLLPYDEITNYIDNLDYAIYGIRPSKIKMAFESAYSVLDKIAIFINRYIPLGVKEEGVGFSKHSFWKEQQRLKSAMRNLRNYYLYALYDIHRDLEKDGFLERLRKMRNVSTHRYIVTHIERIHQVLPDESPENHIDHIDLFNSTLELLKLVRSAIVYLIAFIQMEEQRRHPPSLDRKEIPIIAPKYRHDIFSRYEF